MAVQTELIKLGLHPVSVHLGVVEIAEETIDPLQSLALAQALQEVGFEVLSDKKKQQVEQIKTVIIELVHYTKDTLNVNLSTYLSKKLALGYASLSATFSEMEGVTIEKYFIQQKIERVKELLTYGEKSLSEIAYLLDYSSVAHLSSQFKKHSGQTPSEYKALQNVKRKTLDEI